MNIHDATEAAYKNGYDDGYEAGYLAAKQDIKKEKDNLPEPSFEVGDTVYEVFLYKIRTAKVRRVYIDRLDDPSKRKVRVYEIECDDGTVSPRYTESDVNLRIFGDMETARKMLDYNLECRKEVWAREAYIMRRKATQ